MMNAFKSLLLQTFYCDAHARLTRRWWKRWPCYDQMPKVPVVRAVLMKPLHRKLLHHRLHPRPSPRPTMLCPPGKPPRPPSQQVVSAAQAPPPPKTEGAKLARLRRICELKPSGKCAAGLEVHERWKKADKAEREAMVEELEKANWSKDS